MNQFKRLTDMIANLAVGESFTDMGGNVIERVGEDALAVGPGYNGIIPLRLYLEARKHDTFFGPYPLDPYTEQPEVDAWKLFNIPS